MPLKLLVLDCDGVLIESVDAKTQAFAQVALPYGQEASDALVAFHRRNGGVNRQDKFRWFFAEVLGRKPAPNEERTLYDRFVEYSLNAVTHAMPVPGVWDVLRRWSGTVPIYVASGAPHLELKNILNAQGMSDFCTNIYGAPPGKTTILRGILAETGINPADTVMVGDSSADMYAAEAVHCLFYGRGEYFRHTGYPWSHDLTQLNSYLESLN